MKNSLYSILIMAGMLLFSCDDSLEMFPLDKPSSSTYPSNENELQMAIWGCYGALWLGTNYSMAMPALLDITTDIAAALYNKMYDVAANAAKEVIDMGEYRIDDSFEDTSVPLKLGRY